MKGSAGRMQQQNAPQNDIRQRILTSAHVALFAARVLATPLEVCLRRHFGRSYFGFQAVFCLTVVPLWIGFWPGHSAAYLVGFWWLLVVMFVRARIESVRAFAKGHIWHSRYSGWPRLARIFRKMPEQKIKGLCEPGFGLLAGGLISQLNEPLGNLLIVSAFALFIVQGTLESTEQARATEMNDARIDTEQLAERFRKMSGK